MPAQLGELASVRCAPKCDGRRFGRACPSGEVAQPTARCSLPSKNTAAPPGIKVQTVMSSRASAAPSTPMSLEVDPADLRLVPCCKGDQSKLHIVRDERGTVTIEWRDGTTRVVDFRFCTRCGMPLRIEHIAAEK